MVNTTVTWSVLADEAAIISTANKLEELVSANKTDGIPTITPLGETITEETPGRIVLRTWNTTADAQEWIDFISQFNPDSAVIDPA